MTITEALKDEEFSTMRVTYGVRWLVWDQGGWTVYHQAYRQKFAREIICTGDEEQAVAELLKGMG